MFQSLNLIILFGRLQWSDTFTCVVSWTKTRQCDRSFTVVDLRLWNMLTASLLSLDNYTRFRRLLKADLFEASSDVLLSGAVYKFSHLSK